MRLRTRQSQDDKENEPPRQQPPKCKPQSTSKRRPPATKPPVTKSPLSKKAKVEESFHDGIHTIMVEAGEPLKMHEIKSSLAARRGANIDEKRFGHHFDQL